MAWIGLVLGALIGAVFYGFRGSVAGAAIGFVGGEILRRTQWPGRAPSDPALLGRIARVEERLAALEASLGAGESAPRAPARPEAVPSVAAPAAGAGAATLPDAGPAVTPSAPPEAVPLPVRKGGSGFAPGVSHPAPAVMPLPAGAPNPVWAWFTGGNAMARTGIVVVFFGIAFLLSYFAEHFTVPTEVKFAGVAVLGAAMIGVGARVRLARRAYAMALIGGGLGVLYLTVFAALELVPLLAPPVAFALLACTAALSAVLALRFDAQALATLAAFGGLLAPALVHVDSPVALLFGYVAVVNATVLAIAWHRAWRALNLVGFAFTLVLGLWWGSEYYRPEYFASVEPFLALFFVAYAAVPVANALFAEAGADRRLDTALIFGVPMVAFALQAALVHDMPYGLAWSAAAGASAYAALWLALRRRSELPVAALAAAHGTLALIFASLVVPLVVDYRWTSAIWAVEAAGVYWSGCRQDSPFARRFALLLQLAAGAAFLLDGVSEYAESAFANRQFLGVAAVALSAFATARFGDRLGERLPAAERGLLPLVFAWACAWWLGGGALEVTRHVSSRVEAHAVLGWVVGSVVVGASLASALRWPRLDAIALVLLPALALAIADDLWRRHTSMLAFGWALYPLAWVVHFVVLHRAEQRLPAAARERAQRAQALFVAHAFGAMLLLGQVVWEAGEWTARVTPRGTAWAACAHVIPLAAYLVAAAFAARRAHWPWQTFGEAYTGAVATLVALALGAGFAALSILHPGDASPLPYVPLANPLELTLIFALAALAAWGRTRGGGPPSVRRWIAAGAFVALNGAVIRAVHQWLDVPWRFAALAASRPLQAALTLTWSSAALALILIANRRRMRAPWLAGAGLLGAAVVKLFVVDLAALSGLTRVVAFLGVGVLLLVIGYVAPLPPASNEASNAGSTAPEGPRSA